MPLANLAIQHKREFYAQLQKAKDDGEPGNLAVVAKTFSCADIKQDGEEDDRTMVFTISTGEVDREGDTLAPGGWELEEFRKMGVVLWGHDSSLPPIAEPKDVWVEDGKLTARAKFAPADLDHPMGMGFGATVYRMYQLGLLKAVSVGFDPSDWSFNETRGAGAVDFHKQKLLEFSAVPVPANAGALVQAGRKGLDMRPIYNWCEHELDTGRLIVPRDALEEAHRTLQPEFGPKTQGKNKLDPKDKPIGLLKQAMVALQSMATGKSEGSTNDEEEDMAAMDDLKIKVTADVDGLKQSLDEVMAKLKEVEDKFIALAAAPEPEPEPTLASLLDDPDIVRALVASVGEQVDDAVRKATGAID